MEYHNPPPPSQDEHDDEMDDDDDAGGGGAAALNGPAAELNAMEVEHNLQDDAPVFNASEQLQRVYGFGTAQFSADHALDVYERSSCKAVQLSAWAEDTQDPELTLRVIKLMKAIQESYSAVVAMSNWSGRNDGFVMSTEDMILRFTRKEADEKELSIQSVLKFVLAWCNRLKLRHKGDTVYKQLITRNGYCTYAWVPAVEMVDGRVDVSDLEKLVAYVCSKVHSVDIWTLWLSVNTKSIVDKLRICLEPEFPPLKVTRSWLAFADGLYSVYMDAFIPYNDTARYHLPPDLAVCNYHSMDFAPAFHRPGEDRGLPLHPMAEVKTPLMDKIMATQQLCGHTMYWLWVLLGRMLYFSNVLDSWQVCLFLKGTLQLQFHNIICTMC